MEVADMAAVMRPEFVAVTVAEVAAAPGPEMCGHGPSSTPHLPHDKGRCTKPLRGSSVVSTSFRNCPGTPRWCPGTPSERRSVGEFALEKLAFRSLARPQAAFCGTTWAVTSFL